MFGMAIAWVWSLFDFKHACVSQKFHAVCLRFKQYCIAYREEFFYDQFIGALCYYAYANFSFDNKEKFLNFSDGERFWTIMGVRGELDGAFSVMDANLKRIIRGCKKTNGIYSN